jgi:hypothetical protein
MMAVIDTPFSTKRISSWRKFSSCSRSVACAAPAGVRAGERKTKVTAYTDEGRPYIVDISRIHLADTFTREKNHAAHLITMLKFVFLLLAISQATAAPCNPCGDGYTMTGGGGSFSDGAGAFFSIESLFQNSSYAYIHDVFSPFSHR